MTDLQKMDQILTGLDREKPPSLLLHSCCAPCSTSIIAALSSVFRITVFYYNPNINEQDEYRRRASEQQRLVTLMPTVIPVKFLEGLYNPDVFYKISTGLENEPEGGRRCALCYRLRIAETVRTATEHGFEWCTTTLTVSPQKNARIINEIGEEVCAASPVKWLPSDFKKRNGFLRSVELSKQYDLYRQDWCGCSWSRRDSERRKGHQPGSSRTI